MSMIKDWFTFVSDGLKTAKNSENTINTKASLKKIAPFIKSYTPQIILCLSLVLIATASDLLVPIIQQKLIDNIILHSDFSFLLYILVGFIIVSGVSLFCKTFQNFYINKVEQEVVTDIQVDLFKHILSLPKSFFDNKETDNIITRISSDIIGLKSSFITPSIQMISSIILIVTGSIIMFRLNVLLAICAIVGLPFFFLNAFVIGKKMRSLSYNNMEKFSSLFSVINESIKKNTLIKSFVSNDKENDKFKNKTESSKNAALQLSAVNSLSTLSLTIISSIIKIIVLLLSLWLVYQKQITLGSLIAFQAYIAIVYAPARSLSLTLQSLQSSFAILDRVNSIYETIPENIDLGETAERLKGAISFENVSFAYYKNDPIFENISFEINQSEKVFIIGESGVGKTTLLSLLLCFYTPSTGTIKFDNKSDYSIKSLRNRIAFVSQSNILLSNTILENLTYGNEDINMDKVIEIAKATNIYDFIKALPNGFDTKITDGGVNLSEGQKQRISLARSILKDADIFIFDEPTSSLDVYNESEIMNSISSLLSDKTVLIVTHKLSLLSDNDSVIYIKNKHIHKKCYFKDVKAEMENE